MWKQHEEHPTNVDVLSLEVTVAVQNGPDSIGG